MLKDDVFYHGRGKNMNATGYIEPSHLSYGRGGYLGGYGGHYGGYRGSYGGVHPDFYRRGYYAAPKADDDDRSEVSYLSKSKKK